MERTVVPARSGSFTRRRPSADRRSIAPVGRPGTVPAGGQRLDDRMIAFVRRQEMVFVSPARGERTSRTGPAGFIRVPARRLLAWPEFGRAPISGPVRLLMLDLLVERAGLHVTGRASIAPYGPVALCGSPVLPVTGPRPDYWVRVRVDQAWFADQGPVVSRP